MAVRIKRAADSHTSVLTALDASCFPKDDPGRRTGLAWIAWDGPTAVGFITAHARRHTIERMGVLPAYRGRGLARRLVRACIAGLRRMGATHVQTYTWSANGASINTLIGLGFRFAGHSWAAGGKPRRRHAFITWRLALT